MKTRRPKQSPAPDPRETPSGRLLRWRRVTRERRRELLAEFEHLVHTWAAAQQLLREVEEAKRRTRSESEQVSKTGTEAKECRVKSPRNSRAGKRGPNVIDLLTRVRERVGQ
jgi:hypothetical protein